MMEKYGVTKKHLADSLKYNAIITVAGIIVITVLGYFTGFKKPDADVNWLIFYLVLSVPVQELVFRGIIQTYLYRMGRQQSIIITSALYAAIHYQNILLTVLTLAAGLVWGYAFWKKPNLAGPVISHAILGVYLLVFVI